MNKKLVLLGTALLMTAATASAQTRVTGRVLDAEGNPVIGATVRVQGHKGVSTTDDNGNFTLQNVPASAKKLTVSYLGKTTQHVSIAGNVNVVLQDNETELGEAYVVAYGKATKQAFTGAAVQVKGESIENKGTTNFTTALQGEMAGVTVVNSDGNPGATSSIVIRGLGSLSASTSPLIIVDGTPYGGSMSSIDSKDIETLNVIKDATAAALYGSRGANGVIIITTKRGKKGKLNIGADVKYSVSGRWLPTYKTIKSAERYAELSWEAMRNGYEMQGADAVTAGQYASEGLFGEYGIAEEYNIWNASGANLIDPTTGRFVSGVTRRYNPESWEDELYRTGQKFEGSVNLSGGSDRAQFYTGLGYTKDKGYLVGADFQRFNVRTNVDGQITDWLKGTVNVAYSNLERNAPSQYEDAANNSIDFVNNIPALYGVYFHDANGNRVIDPYVGGYKYDYGDQTDQGRAYAFGINPAGAARLDVVRTNVDQFDANGGLEATFLKDFRFSVNVGYNYYNSTYSEVMNPYYGDGQSANGRLDKEFSTARNITANQILNWGHTFAEDHHLSAFVGHETYWYKNEYTYGLKFNLVQSQGLQFGNAVSYQSLTGYKYDYSLESYFGQVAYDYANKYFFTGSLRADGSSRFTKGNRWGTFGSVSAAWNVTAESFMENTKSWLDNLKIKASWGLIGNQSLSGVSGLGSYYPYATFYTIGNMSDQLALTTGTRGNKNLSWEKTSSWNFGLEFGVLGIIEGEFDYFTRSTRDLLYMKPVSPSLGYASYAVNDGSLRTNGYEFSLTGHVIKQKDLALDIRLNGTHYDTKMTAMPHDEGTGERLDYDPSGVYMHKKGHSIYDFYLRQFMGVDTETGLALYKTRSAYADAEHTELIEENITDMEVFKSQHKGETIYYVDGTTSDGTEALYDFVGESAMPTLSGGLGFDLRYKDFTLGATFSYSLGGKAIDYAYQQLMGDGQVGSNNWHVDIEKRWQNPGDVTDVPRLTNDSDEGYYANITSTRFLTSRSYFALNNVRLAWNVPERITRSWGGMHGVQIYANAENLFYASARKGFLPGTTFTGASSSTQYLPSSSFTIGLKLNF